MTSMQSIIATVSSPLQLLNATEARYQLGIPPRQSHAIAVFPECGSERQIRQVCNVADWKLTAYRQGSVGYGPSNRRHVLTQLLKRRQFFQHLTRLAEDFDPSVILMGSLAADWQRHIAGSVAKINHVMLVDDGVGEIASVKSLSYRRGQLTLTRQTAKQKIAKAILGQSRMNFGRFSWFTTYSEAMDVTPVPIVQNSREWLSRTLAGIPVGKFTTIIGQPFVESGQTTYDRYSKVISWISQRHSKLVVYHPHRRESSHNLARLARDVDMVIAPNALPIELAFVSENVRPSTIVGFYSSALISCAEVLDARTNIIRYRVDDPGFYPQDDAKSWAVEAAFYGTGVELRPLPHVDT